MIYQLKQQPIGQSWPGRSRAPAHRDWYVYELLAGEASPRTVAICSRETDARRIADLLTVTTHLEAQRAAAGEPVSLALTEHVVIMAETFSNAMAKAAAWIRAAEGGNG